MSVNRDVDAELRFHFDARIEELVGQGMSRNDAHARAVEEFGDVDAVRADLRAIDTRVARRRSRIEWLDGVRQDVFYAARALRRAPAVSLTVILTLALGLGANAAMYSLLDVIFVRPPAGVANPAAVRRVWLDRRFEPGKSQMWPGFDYSSYDAVANSLVGKAEVTFYMTEAPRRRSLGAGENAPSAAIAGVPPNYFALLGVKPQYGRFFTADEDGLNTAASVAVVSDALWKRELDGLPDVIGGHITLAKRPYTIIGVAPPGFAGTDLDAVDVWLPIATALGSRAMRPQPWWQASYVNGLQLLIRLRPAAREGEDLARTTAALHSAAILFMRDTTAVAAFGSINRARGPAAMDAALGVVVRLAGVAAIVLLIACANVVNLLLARAVRRRREIAVRIALGVSRTRLVRLLMTESILLSAAAAAAAVAAAVWGGGLMRALLMPDVRFTESPLDWRVLTFALVAAALVGAVAGLIPALQSASPNLTVALKAGARTSGGHRSRLRDALVMVQAALSVLLLVGAVLFVRSLRNAERFDMGYVVDGLLFAELSYDTPDSTRDAGLADRLRAVSSRVAALPGVKRVALASTRPKYSFGLIGYTPEGVPPGRKNPAALFTSVSPSYFAAVGTKLIRGRTFTATPPSSANYEIIINDAMADSLWPRQDPIGRCIHLRDRTAPCATVVGVAQTAMILAFDKQLPQFYLSLDHEPPVGIGASTIVVRLDAESMMAVQHALHDLLRDQFPGAIPKLTTMAQIMEPEYRPWRLGATLFTLFGLLALVVAAIGIYSSVSYAVSQRTHEFGVRLALGAQLGDVLRQVLGEGFRVVATGVVIGILMALAAGRLVAALLYGIAPSDPIALSTVAISLLAIALLAALIPAWRAAQADPVTALRSD